MTTLLVFLVRAYQATLSPDHSWRKAAYPYGYCRFYPTCSEYAIEALRSYGALRGAWLATARLFKCHPWHTGGIDHVPTKVQQEIVRSKI